MNTLPFVDSATIESELQRLWQETAETSASGEAVTRALTLNLIARATDPAMAERISAVARDLVASHPNRTLLAICRPEETPPRIEAWVQANCLLSAPGVPQVCGEQISIDARGPVTAQIASLILALLAPDLPVVLWLPGPAPFDDPLLPRLLGVIDRLIIDSRDLTDPARDLKRMAVFDRDPGTPVGASRRVALSDLGWAALTPWRELTAQFFDTRPLLPHLRRLDQVEIGYVPAGERLNPVPGLLITGWLAACLDWTPLEDAVSIEGATLRLHLRRPAVGVGPRAIRLVTIIITPVGGATPGLASLRLRALDGVTADFHVQRTDDQGHVLTSAEVAGHPPVRRLTRCVEPSLAELVAAELRLLSRDAMFSAALQRAAIFAARLSYLEEPAGR
ncbi:MAG: glucose-6-phosphate dehydrogenase assembly protein OpcA [Oscillochloridaceae bacterium]|nr:glucose-6-phosphate dehydrogenase assembly protein OpcA [Chloroflexaceae bacterium]MDW8390943.1 glucose-6-phosphate dehydrogenase assembly protein OpcA [Oscillochloridaceae bacterium]